mgnify:CR=1 FL=1
MNTHKLSSLAAALGLAAAALLFLFALLDGPPDIVQAKWGALHPLWTEDFSAPISATTYYTTATTGSGLVDNGSFLLTQNAEVQRGRIFHRTPVAMTAFTTTFRFYLGSNDDGADGLAFLFCSSYDYPTGWGSTLDASCPDGYLVGFDTYEGVNGADPDRIYVAHGDTDSAHRLASVAVSNLEDGQWHTATIHFDAPLITVTLDGAHDGTPTADADGAFTYTLNTDAGIADGTHTVGASDDEGSNASDTFTIGSGGETCPEVLDDGGFEASTGDTSNPYWNASDNARFFNTPGGGHGSSDYVALLGYNDTPSTGEVWQSVSVSADAVSGTLSFWYQDWGDNAFALDVDITDGGGSILVDLPDLTGGDSAWQQYNHTFTSGEMTNIAGQSVRLRFRIRDISEIEDVAVDDVSWRICSGSTPPEQRQVSVMPASGPNGTTFTITGTNFTASAVVTLTVDGAFVKTTTADGSGAFSTTYTPISLDVGQHTLVANDGDGQAQTTFEISSPQTGGPFRVTLAWTCLLYTSPSPRDLSTSRMPSSA